MQYLQYIDLYHNIEQQQKQSFLCAVSTLNDIHKTLQTRQTDGNTCTISSKLFLSVFYLFA